jgi:DNA-binding LacI/PurR family transcriptional regulator
MANILDVARAAGVSKTLVSRVINNQKGVSSETRERILKVIKDLNYRANGLARSLVLQKTQSIGVIVDDLCSPFLFDFFGALQEEGERNDYKIIFSGSNNKPEVKQRYIDYFSGGRTDGIIVYGSLNTDENLIRNLSLSNFPFVLIENEIPGLEINNILIDNVEGAYTATLHLVKLGFRNIFHFTGDMNIKVSMDRLNGYVSAMRENGIAIDEGMIIYSDFSEDSGYQKMKNLLDSGIRPEAIFFGADTTAFGAIRAIYEAGLKVPQDIAIVGFDDDKPESRDIVFPQLTTVRQPMEKVGKCAVATLVNNISSPDNKCKKLIYKTELIIRKSCGA